MVDSPAITANDMNVGAWPTAPKINPLAATLSEDAIPESIVTAPPTRLKRPVRAVRSVMINFHDGARYAIQNSAN